MASYSNVHGERVTYGATEEDGQLCSQVPKRKEKKGKVPPDDVKDKYQLLCIPRPQRKIKKNGILSATSKLEGGEKLEKSHHPTDGRTNEVECDESPLSN
jgi:hypothetical protein